MFRCGSARQAPRSGSLGRRSGAVRRKVSLPNKLGRSSSYRRDLPGQLGNQCRNQSAPLALNEGKIDITTSQGKAAFREELLKLADKSIKVLKDVNAQGMITWDPEGQEFLASCYYGDPRLTPVLAPETGV